MGLCNNEKKQVCHSSIYFTTTDSDCFKVSFPGWGETYSVEGISENRGIFEILTEDKFYIRNRTIRAAPYDFRKAPSKYFLEN